jgi:type IV pilus assembly protein PilE
VQEGAQNTERWYTIHMTYAGADAPTAQLLNCSSDVTNYYTVGFNGAPDATTYVISATPIAGGPQEKDTQCGALAVDQKGKRYYTPSSGTSTEDTTGVCW